MAPGVPPRLRASYEALRHEYLRVKAQSYDGHADLPTQAGLAAALRDALERHRCLGVAVLSFENLRDIEESLGWQVADTVQAQACEALRALLALHSGAEAWVAQDAAFAESFVVHVPLPAQDGPGCLAGFEALVAELREDLLRWLEEHALPEGRELRLAAGWSVLLPHSGVRFERLLQRAAQEARAMLQLEAERDRLRRKLELRRILQERALTAVFQPIVDLRTFGISGYEALTRGPRATPWEAAEHLFSASQEHELSAELCMAAREGILAKVGRLAPGRQLFLNVVPEAVQRGASHHERLRDLVEAAGLRCEDVVLEIGERARIESHEEFRRQLEPLRRDGFRIAIDDVGAGYSSLRLIPELEPDYLKVDSSLVRRLPESPARQGLVASLVHLGERLHAQVVCEGIETAEELAAVRELGAHHGQGFLFARPEACPAETVTLPAGFEPR